MAKDQAENQKFVTPCCGTCQHMEPKSGPLMMPLPAKKTLLSHPNAQPQQQSMVLAMCGNPEAPRYAILQSAMFGCDLHKYHDDVPEEQRLKFASTDEAEPELETPADPESSDEQTPALEITTGA